MLCKAQIIKRSSFSVSASIMETITGLHTLAVDLTDCVFCCFSHFSDLPTIENGV